MKIAITGKGGVGKTTVSALLSHLYESEGKKVIAVEKDTPTEEISKIFSEKSIRCLPVLDKGEVVGVVLRKTVINRLLGHYY